MEQIEREREGDKTDAIAMPSLGELFKENQVFDPGKDTFNTNLLNLKEDGLLLSLSAAEKKSDDLERKILRIAEEIRQRNDRRSTYAWWISALLFALGSGLGLVGKLYGVPGAEVGGTD